MHTKYRVNLLASNVYKIILISVTKIIYCGFGKFAQNMYALYLYRLVMQDARQLFKIKAGNLMYLIFNWHGSNTALHVHVQKFRVKKHSSICSNIGK